jgi:three-Cys-motif partner protein
MNDDQLDTIGYWTEIKLLILKEYADAYAKVLKNQPHIKHIAYIDAFAGAGAHISKTSGEQIAGSPALALSVQPPFSHYHFIEMDEKRANRLRQQYRRPDVTVHHGDCNQVLIRDVFPKCRFDDYRRALCLLDPYALNPRWEVVETAGKMRSIEIFLNFMIMDANMNVLRKNPAPVSADQASRMTAFWGDDSWRKAAYKTEQGLFGDMEDKAGNDAVVAAYRERLPKVARFKYVPQPLPMRNSKGATIYYLFFASNNQAGNRIAESIFKKYRNHVAH